MAAVNVVEISQADAEKIRTIEEGHFADVKAIEVPPAKLTRSLSGFCNAEGGELYVGISECTKTKSRNWSGFDSVEAANGHLQCFEDLFPMGVGFSYCFMRSKECHGLVLKIEVHKSREIRPASDGKVYQRCGAQNLPVDGEKLKILERNKGLTSFETETVAADPALVTDSLQVTEFMIEVVPHSEPEPWLTKQQLIRSNLPTVAGLALFADEPQAVLPKQCGIKLCRYKTGEAEGSRETLAFDPLSIEGSVVNQIRTAVGETTRIIESVKVMTAKGLTPIIYPETALHEIITNAVLHRDYSIADDIHVRIFDNRVEILSPGTLPAHITPENILTERFARNGMIVRIVNKFPDAPNKDIGEGLNTAFAAMKKMNLKDPQIEQDGGYVKVVLRHESLGTPQELIVEFLETHEFIANKDVREICYVKSENAAKHILKRMVDAGELEVVPGETKFHTKYRRAPDKN